MNRNAIPNILYALAYTKVPAYLFPTIKLKIDTLAGMPIENMYTRRSDSSVLFTRKWNPNTSPPMIANTL